MLEGLYFEKPGYGAKIAVCGSPFTACGLPFEPLLIGQKGKPPALRGSMASPETPLLDDDARLGHCGPPAVLVVKAVAAKCIEQPWALSTALTCRVDRLEMGIPIS